ncbi:MAG: thymidylate synthase [Gemmataceae bacterium]
MLLRLTDPRARLSHTEKKGKMFSAVGELLWYLAASDRADFVSYYIPLYSDEAEADGSIHGAYGPRIFLPTGASQFDNVIARLRERATTRKAVIQLFEKSDLDGDYRDVPCTCALQFLLRGDRLHLAVSMRSSDAFYGLPHDVFTFTMLQEIVARTLGCELGHYTHFAGSLHIYQPQLGAARNFLAEGWQDSLVAAMPAMPHGDPWPGIGHVLNAEDLVRSGKSPGKRRMSKLAPYWQDLVRLLQAYSLFKRERYAEIPAIKKQMAHQVYKEYVVQKARPKKSVPRTGQPLLFESDDSDAPL